MNEQFETQGRTLWLLCHDKDFIHKFRDVDPKVMPLGPARYLVDLSLRNFNAYRTTLSQDTVAIAMESDGARLRRNRTEPNMVVRVWRDLDVFAVSEPGLPSAREACGVWLAARGAMARIEEASSVLDKGDWEAAEAILAKQHRPDAREEAVGYAHSDYILAEARYGTGRTNFIRTGIHDWDNALRGGYEPETIGMVAAPTGIGKSQVLSSFQAASFWQGKRSIYYTAELTPEQVTTRTTLGALRKGLYDLKLDAMDDEWLRAMRYNRVTEIKGDFTVRSMEGIGWAQMQDDVDRYRDEHGAYPDVLFLDSIDDMTAPVRSGQEWQDLKQSWRTAREFAQRNHVAIWSSSQMKAEAVDGQFASLKKVAGAYAKATLCHYVIGIAQTPEERIDPGGPVMNLFILKDSLHGTTGGWIVVRTEWGDGDNGYPGMDLVEARNLPLLKGGMG